MAPLIVDKAAQQAERKKSKKAKKVQEVEASGDGEAQQLSKKELKKLKKQQQEAAAAENSAIEEHEPQIGKEERKKLKKQRKEAAAEQANGDAADAEGSKKQKKKKKRDDADEGTQAGVDAGAANGKPSKKAKKSAAANGSTTKGSYTPHPAVAAMSESAVQAWRSEHNVAVKGCELRPVTAFAHAGFTPDVLKATATFTTPSPIQAQCWPIVMAGRDLVGIAATGSGKTLAFGLPALQRIVQRTGTNAAGPSAGVTVLVLAPTRELAMQTAGVLETAGAPCNAPAVCIYGGVPKKDQISALRRGARVVVGTPGRLQDLIEDGSLRLGSVDYVVLDEADRMLDLGFEPAVRAILSKTHPQRQTLMFSATWPTIVQKLAGDFLKDPVKVTIGSQKLAASHSVSQTVEVVEAAAKDSRLLALLDKYHNRKNRVIVFVLYKKEAVRVEQMLTRKGWNVAAVHGDLSQAQRTQAVESFKAGSSPLLLATDVAARGLDIPDVEVVINYSFPLTTEDYVHRIGRTGRAGKTGIAHTLFCGAADKPRAGELINVLREAGQPVPEELLKFGTTVKRKESKLYGAHFKDVDMTKKATKVTFDDSDDE